MKIILSENWTQALAWFDKNHSTMLFSSINYFIYNHAIFLVTPCLVVAVQPCMEWILIKKKYVTRQVNIHEHTYTHYTHTQMRTNTFMDKCTETCSVSSEKIFRKSWHEIKNCWKFCRWANTIFWIALCVLLTLIP